MVVFGYKFGWSRSNKMVYKYLGVEICSLGIITFSIWNRMYDITWAKWKGVK